MTLYLSRLSLDPRSRRAQAELRDPYQMHRTLSKAFGDGRDAWEAARVLFRVDEIDCVPVVLVQSRTPPDWSRLSVSEQYLSHAPAVKQLQPCLRAGQRLLFRLLANPTVKRDGKRWGLVKEEEQLAWLDRKGNVHGFRVVSASANSQGRVNSRTAEGCAATLLAVRFDGLLEVTEPELFAGALESGIGSAKGFGFGLLSVAPATR